MDPADRVSDAPLPAEPDINDDGVDLAQIREMLSLSPEQRLRRMQGLAESILSIRERNEGRAVR